jgi:hypothetical protein
MLNHGIEEVFTQCPVCAKPVVSRWVPGGMLHDNTIALVGDLLFHGDCWDQQIAEHPPG